MTSTAVPEQTPAGVHELVRRWSPEGEPRARVVLCHGLAEHSGRYEAVGTQLAAAGYGVTAYDQIGFGASGGERAWVDQWSDVLDQIQRHVEDAKSTGEPVILLGHSVGGLLALEYALSERPQPDLLILSSPALNGGARWQRITAPILAAIAPKLRVPNAVKGSQLSRDPAVGDAYFADPLVETKTTTRYGNEVFTAIERVRGAVSGLGVPTLVLHGAADTLVPPQGSALLGELPTVERRLYPALRHELFNEPEGPEIVAEVVDWIDHQLESGT
ncbi:MAG: alpha/beta hydrolase [Acidimicrobiia bacterium]|nr:alpha/beta hydrolase [Acidimicrobiia bacterium]